MRPLDRLYSSPADILAEAKRDRDALLAAADAGDEQLLQDKLFDFSVTAYHIVDWLRSFLPHLEAATYGYLDSNPALQACRDIANSHKHNALDLAKGAYRNFPPVVDRLDYSLGAVSSICVSPGLAEEEEPGQLAASPPRRLKVQFAQGSRSSVEDIANDAVAAWERFFALHGIS